MVNKEKKKEGEIRGEKKENLEKNPKKVEKPVQASEESFVPKIFNIVTWLTGVIVSLSVAFGMIGGTLTLPAWLGGVIVAKTAGWIVVVATLLGVILAIFNK